MDTQNQDPALQQNTPQNVNNNPYNIHTQQNNIFYPIIDSLSGWMKFIGIYTVVIGAITCLGIITCAIGIPMIFSGLSLVRAAKSITLYQRINNPFSLNDFLLSLGKYFKIQGIFIIIGIVLSIVYVMIFLFFAVMTFNTYYYQYY